MLKYKFSLASIFSYKDRIFDVGKMWVKENPFCDIFYGVKENIDTEWFNFFLSNVPFLFPGKYQKTKGFLMFSVGLN